jgi:hypothetical protein
VFSTVPAEPAQLADVKQKTAEEAKAVRSRALVSADISGPPPASAPAPAAPAIAGSAATLGAARIDAVNSFRTLLSNQAAAPADKSMLAKGMEGTRGTARKAAEADTAAFNGGNVLNNFELQRDGNRIRIIDTDGSIYDGRLAITEPATVALSQPSQPARPQQQPAPAPARPSPSNQYSQSASPDGSQTFFIQALGTNRTLNQAVTIDALLVQQSDNAANLQFDAAKRQAQAAAQKLESNSNVITQGGLAPVANQPLMNQNQFQQSNALRLHGRARVGTNEVPVDAVPVSPP